MKLLKTIGKLLSIPFNIINIAIIALAIPFKVISSLLMGNFTEWNEKRKFTFNAVKEMIKAALHGKDYSFLRSVAYITENGKMLEMVENINLTKDSDIIHLIDYVETEIEQKGT